MAGRILTQDEKDERAAKMRAKRAAERQNAGEPPARPRAARVPQSVKHAEAVAGMLNLLSVPLMGLGRVNESFLADALTLQMNASPVGDAVAEVAKINPAVGDWLEKGAPAAPYILLGTVLFSLGTQLAVNHGVNLGPLGNGTHPRAVMVAEAKARAAAVEQARKEEEVSVQQQEDAAAQRMAEFDPEHVDPPSRDENEAARRAAEREADSVLEPVI
jgi:hypothetical protein